MDIFVYLFASILFISLDFSYLYLMKNYLTNQIETVQKSKIQIRYLGVAICYLFLLFCYLYFILYQKRSIHDAFLLGICIYGVYEMSNYAFFTNWSILTVLLDTLWGGILFSATTYLTKLIRKL
jgi:uncharacterized membrane protein